MINDLSANDIVTPVIIAPSNNVIDFPINFTTRTISFRTRSGKDTHEHSVWEIATDEAFTNIERTFETPGNMGFTPIDNLKHSTTYYLRVKYVGESGNESDWSSAIKVTTIEDLTPKRTVIEIPKITYPTYNLTDVPVSLTATASVFSLSEGDDEYHHSVWVLSIDADFITPVETIQSDNDAFSIELDTLEYQTDYYLRVKHVSNNGTESYWSPVIKFTTLTRVIKPIIVDIATPEILALLNNATNVSTSFVVPVTEFIVLDGEDTHDYSQWEVSTDSVFAFTDEDYISKSNVYEQSVSSLRHEKIYYIRVRHVGKSGCKSNWSPVVKFTTIPQLEN